ncbi:ABC transporter permease [Natrononativus amylolyticus]|uniref:ABC transporter permease n=1 Tax=Natrononativus amylolyticus TaxID=2963434 RepID=UPI0020CFA9AA|nr:ABC transporter permease [Natrononativus amylolyticus]
MSLRRPISRGRAVVGLAVAQLRRSKGRAVLATFGVALAVLSVTLLASLGVGVIETGQEGFDESGRDVWITGGPTADSADSGENAVVDAHRLTAEIEDRDDVSEARTIALHDVYIGTDPDDRERLTAVGVQGTHRHFEFEAGDGFGEDVEDDQGRLTGEGIVVDPDVADRFDLEVGDTVYVGSEDGPGQPFTVVGVGSYYSQFLGAETVTVPLTELQGVTGSAASDRAAFVTVNVADDADRETVRDDLAAEYPEYDVRTNDDQLGAMVQDRLLIVASALALVGLAVCGGITLTTNLFVLVAYQQRDELAALRAIGLSRGVLAGTIGVQGFLIGLVGGVIGVVATLPIAIGLNHVSAVTVGFERIVRPIPEVYALGFAIALLVGTLVAVVTGWQTGRHIRLERLEA